MSIYDELLYWVRESELFEFEPQMPGTLSLRRMFVSKHLHGAPWHEGRYGLLRADLDRFTEGAMIPVRLPPSKSVKAYLALLDETSGVWEIRSTKPEPQLRVFGFFPHMDTFLAVTWNERRELDSDEEWQFALKVCKREWQRLFPAYVPLTGTNIHDYLSKQFLLL